MDICGEHGDDIAYIGRDCPACAQIEQIKEDHKDEVAEIEEELNMEIRDLEDRVYELENK